MCYNKYRGDEIEDFREILKKNESFRSLQGGLLSSVRRDQIVLNPLNMGLFILA